jgi:hypothetical protein
MFKSFLAGVPQFVCNSWDLGLQQLPYKELGPRGTRGICSILELQSPSKNKMSVLVPQMEIILSILPLEGMH